MLKKYAAEAFINLQSEDPFSLAYPQYFASKNGLGTFFSARRVFCRRQIELTHSKPTQADKSAIAMKSPFLRRLNSGNYFNFFGGAFSGCLSISSSKPPQIQIFSLPFFLFTLQQQKQPFFCLAVIFQQRIYQKCLRNIYFRSKSNFYFMSFFFFCCCKHVYDFM